MGAIEDIRKILADIPLWKRLGTVPDEVDDLKKRVAELEQKLSGPWPADVCRYCGKRAARLQHSDQDRGMIMERYDCKECGNMDFRYRKPT